MDHNEFMAFYTKNLFPFLESKETAAIRRVIEENPGAKDYLINNTHFGPEQHANWGSSYLAPLQRAVVLSSVETAKLLVEDLDVNVDSIQTMIKIKMPRDNGYDYPRLTQPDYKGSWTSLHLAVFKDDLPMVETLLELGADESIGGNINRIQFNNAMDLAKKLRNTKIVEAFEKTGLFGEFQAATAGPCAFSLFQH